MEESTEFTLSRECSLCLNFFTDPRILPCLHTFCLKCLENTGVIKPEERMLCPVCGSDFTVPEEGLSGLPKNVFAEKSAHIRTITKYKTAEKLAEKSLCDVCIEVNYDNETFAEKYCINCEQKLCLICSTEHGKQKEHLIVDLNHQEETKNEDADASLCRVHQEDMLKLYCTYCKKVICDKCRHESHCSHSCTDVTDVVSLVCKQAEKEYNSIENMQSRFQEKRETLHREQMKFLEKVKKTETNILKRCEEIKELVVQETKALLQELAVLKKERLEEIEMEQRNIDKHVFTLEKFKEYCAWIKSKGALSYTCEAGCILRNTADHLRSHQKSYLENNVFPLQFVWQKTEVQQLVAPISSAIGKINVTCPYKMEQLDAIDTHGKVLHGMTSLGDKLYLLSDSILIHRAQKPYEYVGEIKTQEIQSPTGIVSCSKTSCLYFHDKGNACIWKVSIPKHEVTRWFDKVNGPCAMSVSPNGEVLMLTQTEGQPVTLEIYNQNAIPIGRTELPKTIQSLRIIYETSSGNYIGFGEQKMYKIRKDGSIICEADMIKYPESEGYARYLELSPYHISLISRSLYNVGYSKVSSAGNVLSWPPTWHPPGKEKIPFGLCYIKATKSLAVLEQNQIVKGKALEVTQTVRIYNVL